MERWVEIRNGVIVYQSILDTGRCWTRSEKSLVLSCIEDNMSEESIDWPRVWRDYEESNSGAAERGGILKVRGNSETP